MAWRSCEQRATAVPLGLSGPVTSASYNFKEGVLYRIVYCFRWGKEIVLLSILIRFEAQNKTDSLKPSLLFLSFGCCFSEGPPHQINKSDFTEHYVLVFAQRDTLFLLVPLIGCFI